MVARTSLGRECLILSDAEVEQGVDAASARPEASHGLDWAHVFLLTLPTRNTIQVVEHIRYG